MRKTILLVEDDSAISDMVKRYLSNETFNVECVFDGEAAASTLGHAHYDLVLLDLMLPKLNGMDFLQMVRTKSYVPVIIMSAKDSEVDKALGLGFGADDYITKPFSMIELVARVKAAIRRSTQYIVSQTELSKSIIKVHEIELDTDNHCVMKKGVEIHLTSKELKILHLFFENQKKVFTKEQIYRSVWGEDYYGDENIINVHMSRLRERIEDSPSKPVYIKTLWGIGYKLGEFK
ncbi:response regulator transcription factor [Bacillus atrophaeus]|uniref:response regulator transcription factor n=1 Tax=Bacillus atrophaeus TaxID=1452 RepID=UPI00227F30E8|nr:response regulator transcription factor [Bacillus atrophaeus]MCY8932436.1 response regulator transcription factor [Bacillus atrophaeus]MCY8941121.1 response regulator transcription factor [Bacillus atrophaeus]MCY8947748.1 response regulator transcription factor [Bacillus atrophaeus]